MKEHRRIAAFALSVAFLGIPSYGIDIFFRMSGSLSFSGFKDSNLALRGWEEYQKKDSQNIPGGLFLSSDMKKFGRGIDLEGEIIVFLKPRLAVGLGAGIAYNDLPEADAAVNVQASGTNLVLAYPEKAAASSIYFSGYYLWPVSPKLYFYLKGGMGFLAAKYIQNEARRKAQEANFVYLLTQTAASNGLFSHGGLGLNYQFESGFELFVEVAGRLARLSGFEGDLDPEHLGTLYYYEEYHSQLDLWKSTINLLAEEPSGENFRSVRKAVIDFSGISVKIGFQIKF